MRAIAIDIGNTRIKAGLFVDSVLLASAYFSHDELEALGDWVSLGKVSHVIYSSTADESLNVAEHLHKEIELLALDTGTPVPITIDYDRSTLGLDRLANAVAGHTLHPEASLVIDAGTCVTFDWTVEGVYLGGSISPGLHMRLKAMHEFTGRLPLIEEPTLGELIGKNTVEAMNSGAFHGFILEIQGVISRFLSRYPLGHVYLTGGDSLLLAEPIENDIFADPLLTLHGLIAILEYTHA